MALQSSDARMLAAALARAQAAQAVLQQENQWLRQKLQAFIARYLGGKKSEQLDPAQLQLLMAGLVELAVPASSSPAKPVSSTPIPRQTPVRQKLPPHLKTETIRLEPEEVRQNPEGWKQIGEEVTETLDWQAAQFIRRLYVRPKYVRGERIEIAELPVRWLDKSLAEPGLAAQITLSKFEDHLPLYRQERIYRERYGVELSRKTMGEWVERVAFWLQSIWRVMKEELVGGGYLQVDETPIRYLDPDADGVSRKGFLWAYSRPGKDVVFDWNVSRGREGPEQFLAGFQGKLQSDGYAVYAALAKDNPGVQLFFCWAHARRYFVEALESDRRAAWYIGQIAHLYRIEKRLREKKAGARLRQAVRASESQMILSRLKKALEKLQVKALPRSLLGTAVSYALNLWEGLERYVVHGEIEIDNNLIENAIRPTALGKKNWLFIGHPEAGWRSAVIYSLLGSCRRHGVNTQEYLTDVLKRIPTMQASQVKELTPSAWAKAQRSKPNKS
ncbi:MAG TPA: IS66 family transposase [Candidatus Angelobacter sp.]|jgi:transposase|nr:IS66 family transposase [Candidatus Angelobacter sp.]